MNIPILTVQIGYEKDVVLCRQRARQIAAALGFEKQDQARIATAVSELARNVYQYAGQGRADFFFNRTAQALEVRIEDQGPGIANLKEILEGGYTSTTGMGVGLVGTKRLMDKFAVETGARGTTIHIEKALPAPNATLTPSTLARLGAELEDQPHRDSFGEVQQQNQELLAAMNELERRRQELDQLNRELEDTNRGVVALYAELEEKADYLRRASEIKSSFLSNMSHEFRTPLNSILSLTRMLLDRTDGDLTSEQEKQLGFIRRGATDLSELVNDLLDLSKVEAGKVEIRPTQFTVADLFGALRGMLRPLLAHNSSINLVFEEAPGIPALFTDESKLAQILRNFISNAIKFTENGEVRVSARVEGDDTLVIAVADTGVGIRPEDQERIFEEFTQVEGPLQRKSKGTGLGLPLAKRLAELLGGGVGLESEEGRGSTFSVRLPAVFAQEAAKNASLGAPTADPTRLPVLFLDEDATVFALYEKYLKETPFQAYSARTTVEAQEMMGTLRPAAVVLDVVLERGNSWEFLRELRESPATRHVPVLVVTRVENRSKALELGAADFHLKPVPRDWLVARLGEAVRRGPVRPVLVVDDDEVARYLMRTLLAGSGRHLVEAAGGRDGLRLARQLAPALIVLDLVMPDLNGFAVLDLLRDNPETSSIPVIVHSSKTLAEEERRGLERRVVAVLSKSQSSRGDHLDVILRTLEGVTAPGE